MRTGAWCGRRETNPHRPFEPCGFSLPSTAFAARVPRFTEPSASGLRSGLSLHPLPDDPGLRCCPSSLYTFPASIDLNLFFKLANGERITVEEMQRLIERTDADKLKKAQAQLEQAAGSGVKG